MSWLALSLSLFVSTALAAPSYEFLVASPPEELSPKWARAPVEAFAAVIPFEKLPSPAFYALPSVDLLPKIKAKGLIISPGEGALLYENAELAREEGGPSSLIIPVHFTSTAQVVEWTKLPDVLQNKILADSVATKLSPPQQMHTDYGVAALRQGHFIIMEPNQVVKPANSYSEILKFLVQELERTKVDKMTFTQVVHAFDVAFLAKKAGESGVDKILNPKKSGQEMMAETFGRNPVDDMRSLISADPAIFVLGTANKIVQKIESKEFKSIFIREIWLNPKKVTPKLWFFSGQMFPTSSNDPAVADIRGMLVRAVRNQASQALKDSPQLKLDIPRSPISYVRLYLDKLAPAEIKIPIAEILLEPKGREEFEKNFAQELRALTLRRNYDAWELLAGLPKELGRKVLAQLPYKAAQDFDQLKAQSFQNGELTILGNWLLQNDPKAMNVYLGNQNALPLDLKIETLNQLQKGGLSTTAIMETSRITINNGHPTEFGRWAFANDNRLMLHRIEAQPTMIRGATLAEYEYYRSQGVSPVLILKSGEPVIYNDRITEFGKWAIQKFPSETFDRIPKFQLRVLRKADIQYLRENKFPEQILESYK